jgi:hypothetical protein
MIFVTFRQHSFVDIVLWGVQTLIVGGPSLLKLLAINKKAKR